ncbi:MAG: putative NAD(P)H-dependent FMN-containing oxidoreductase YwqN [Firmicutes bacterium ADurb.Bin506]|jgi:multimeric flavodoxin WrbA|nr:MAG: putative NAD(P)H-dependent FMN-containing oxidoreductase YwqN [Firmicutes bacterium ADurb.Bin506]
MKVLAFCGSPRQHGNTRTLVDEMARGIVEAGAECEIVDVGIMDIAPCTACEGCHRTGVCVVDDDMTPLYDKIDNADAFVFASPVYFWGPSAQFKAFLDRWFAIVHGPAGDRLNGKKAAVVAAFGDDDPATARHLIGMLETAFSYLGLESAGSLGVTADKLGEAKANTEALKEAFAFGQSLVD